MKNIGYKVVSSAVALACGALPAFAQTVEPSEGFVTGPQPEWQSQHVEGESSAPQHREYHRQGEQALLQWLRNNPSSMDGYSRLRRDYYQMRNLAHRQYHDPIWEPESMYQPMGSESAFVIPGSAGTENLPVVAIIIPNRLMRTPGVEHKYDGEKPSRRTIRALADLQFNR